MWFLPVGSRLIPPWMLPGEAGFTPRTLTRPEQTTSSQDPETRRAVSAAPQNQKQPSAPSEPPRSPRLRVRQVVLRALSVELRDALRDTRGAGRREPSARKPAHAGEANLSERLPARRPEPFHADQAPQRVRVRRDDHQDRDHGPQPEPVPDGAAAGQRLERLRVQDRLG